MMTTMMTLCSNTSQAVQFFLIRWAWKSTSASGSSYQVETDLAPLETHGSFHCLQCWHSIVEFQSIVQKYINYCHQHFIHEKIEAQKDVSDMPKVTLWVSGRHGNRSQISWLPGFCSLHEAWQTKVRSEGQILSRIVEDQNWINTIGGLNLYLYILCVIYASVSSLRFIFIFCRPPQPPHFLLIDSGAWCENLYCTPGAVSQSVRVVFCKQRQ